MTRERYDEFMDWTNDATLTQEELDAGWHWCLDFDGLLVGPEMTMEWDCCTCRGGIGP